MCGITGFVDFTQASTSDTLSNMARTLGHRGPDGRGQMLSTIGGATIGLAHTRLAVIDLSSAAAQPMHHDGLTVVFNGEIYNHAELRQELTARGHLFTTHSDTEVILHGWREWGAAAIEKWRGMFAIVILDRNANELVCIRDRAGVKPLYWSYTNGLFLFGSELKSLMAHPSFRRQVDPSAVASFLQYGYVSAPHSIFCDTFKLKPGSLLRLDLDTGKTSTTQYWSVYEHYRKPKLSLSLEDAIDETERILRESFELRLVSDVPVGIFLSGGYDSTCVASLLQSGRTKKLKTFTIGMPDATLDEAPYAKAIAGHLGTDHTEYYCTADDALELVPQLPEWYDEPFGDSSALPTLLVSRMARRQVTVALSADGGDEAFAGYNRYDYIDRFGKRLQRIPAPARKLLARALDTISSESVPYLNRRSTFHSRFDKVKNLLRDPSTSELLRNLTQVTTGPQLSELMAVPFEPLRTMHGGAGFGSMPSDALSFMLAVDYDTYLPDDILQKVDRATMSVSLEGREPFLDQHILEWAARLPSELKLHRGVKKRILRDIVHRHVPRQMMDRPKMGFGIPIHRWLASELRPLVEHHLSATSLRRHGLLSVGAVEGILQRFYAGHTHLHLQVWYLLSFQMWYERWAA